MRECFICGKLYEGGREMTCSDACHGELVKRLGTEFGEFKKVVDQTTGTAYRVPTRDIIGRVISNEIIDKIVELSAKAITDQLSHQADEQVAKNFCLPRCGGAPDGKLCPDAERIHRLFVALFFELYSRSN